MPKSSSTTRLVPVASSSNSSNALMTFGPKSTSTPLTWTDSCSSPYFSSSCYASYTIAQNSLTTVWLITLDDAINFCPPIPYNLSRRSVRSGCSVLYSFICEIVHLSQLNTNCFCATSLRKCMYPYFSFSVTIWTYLPMNHSLLHLHLTLQLQEPCHLFSLSAKEIKEMCQKI